MLDDIRAKDNERFNSRLPTNLGKKSHFGLSPRGDSSVALSGEQIEVKFKFSKFLCPFLSENINYCNENNSNTVVLSKSQLFNP